MPDSSAIDYAVVAVLRADATLMALVPDGVHRDEAPQGKTRFIVVSTPSSEDLQMFGATAFETQVYLVKAVLKELTVVNADAAAARIKTDVEAMTAATGYGSVTAQRTERVAYTEIDPDDADARWQHRGGLYELTVA